jgi:DNA-binding beta-propeller fold protein YncE
MGVPRMVAAALMVTLGAAAAAEVQQAPAAPMFQVDAAWPRIPNNWVLGEVSSVAAGPGNQIWVLHRPRSIPEGQRTRAAPPVVRFDTSGRLTGSWGGPGDGYEWPDREHAIYVDSQGFVWITGNAGWDPPATDGRSDDMILKFTPEGRLVLQIGRRGKSTGNSDTSNVHQAADVFVHAATNELFVADGYGNQRVVVFDAGTGRFKRLWGAFGNVPPAAMTRNSSQSTSPDAEVSRQFGLVHGVEVSNDGIVYVADRTHRRVQTFTILGTFLQEARIRGADGTAGVPAGLAFSPDPEQQFLYVIDSGRIAILDRATLMPVGMLGQRGQFGILHHIAADADGSVYTADVRAQRAQRFVLHGGR